jgi:hypothetical protein
MPVWKVRSWHSCQVLLRERLAGGKSEARLDPIAIGGLGTHLRVEFESCLDIRLKSSDVDYEHHDPRKNVKMVRTIKRNGAEGTGEWDTDMRRVVSFATEKGPRLYLHCQHQYEHTTTNTAKSHAPETHTNIFAKGLTRRLRSSAPSTSPSAMDTSVVS